MLSTHKCISRSITWHLSQVESLTNTNNRVNNVTAVMQFLFLAIIF